MIVPVFALLLALQGDPAGSPQDNSAPETGPRRWTDGQIFWRRFPIPEVPAGETGQVQARFTCTIARRGAVRDCRIDRALPADSRFGRRVLGGMSRAELRLVEGMRPGDAITFTLWACADPLTTCERRPWPEA